MADDHILDIAISNLWTAQQSTDEADCTAHLATGLQQMVYAVQSGGQSSIYLQPAIDNAYSAANVDTSQIDRLRHISTALQQYCASMKSGAS
jgi:hypothetical protein